MVKDTNKYKYKPTCTKAGIATNLFVMLSLLAKKF